MDKALKKKLLTRKFSSIEYMEEMHRNFKQGLLGLKESIQWFYNHPPKNVDWQNWHVADRPDGWEDRALPNFEGLEESIKKGIEDYINGDPDRIRGTSNNIMSLSKDMDVLGELWWDYVDLSVARKYGVNMNEAEQRAANIYWTIGNYWDDDEILDEEITGPTDEQDLLRYLQPGEKI